MRIWSLHPKYLDSKGLIALWREALLAKKVLEGATKGYINHSQLHRFRELTSPLDAINHYLGDVYEESLLRAYHFDGSKINPSVATQKMSVTSGQLEYEREHLLEKLRVRDPDRFDKLKNLNIFEAHPLFKIVSGPLADWERISSSS